MINSNINIVMHPKCDHLIDTYDYGWGLDVVRRDKYMNKVRE